MAPFLVPEREPLAVPATSIYSRTDGVVRWQLCLESKGPISENVEVLGSHSGLGFNTAAAYVIADRLSQPEGDWRGFRPPLWLRSAFPRPADHRPRDLR
jgi:hypothetical protein